MFSKISKNTLGTDYVVSDLHGCYDLLISQLNILNFNKTKDRLFIVGDLIDRGSQNLECLSLLKEDWVHCVLGNHEYMFFNYLLNIDQDLFLYNGGDWVLDYSIDDLNVYKSYISNLPLMIETTVKGKSVGFVHADIQDWNYSKNLLKNSLNPFKENYNETMRLIWSRDRVSRNDNSTTNGIDLVFLGHTPQKDVKILGNNIYIDTGAVFNTGKLTILRIEDYV